MRRIFINDRKGWLKLARPQLVRVGVVPCRSASRPARVILLWATMLALLWQSFLIQSHVHTPLAIIGHAAVSAELAPHQARDDAADCPLCREFAQAGAFLLPGGVTLPTAQAVLTPVVSRPLPAPRLVRAPSPWRSRAPPVMTRP